MPVAALKYAAQGCTNNSNRHSNHHHNQPNGIIAKKGALFAPPSLPDEDACPQCGVKYNTTSCRKVTESCGHSKCRRCIIKSEDGCSQCAGTSELGVEEENSMEASTSNSPPVLNTAVVIKTAHQNKPLVGPPTTRRARMSALGTHATTAQLKEMSNSQPFSSNSLTTISSSPPTLQSEKSKGERTASKRRSTTRDSSYYTTGTPARNTSSSTVHSTTVQQPMSTESGRKLQNAVVKEEIAESFTPADSPDSVNDETEKADSDRMSTEQFQDVPKEENVSKDDDVDDAEERDEPVEKKKKKRCPVVIYDHITVLGGQPPMYHCSVCQKKFKTKAHIKYHEFCQKGDKPLKCKECGQGFIVKSHYEYHLRTHTGELPFVCPKCGKRFNQRGKVTRHMRSHTGEKPFICQECNRGFSNAQGLRAHTMIHTGERPYACTYCNKRFTGMTNLKKHVITHTGERPFSCNHCGKSFGLKWTLDLHLKTHSSERPYACDQCSRAFSNNKDLRRHLVIHSCERPFKCWICGISFRRKDNLDRHIKNIHKQLKEVAKQLANEAAAEYLKLNPKNQSLGNIPVSNLNSVVVSNNIKNADLLPPGGIVPNNLKSKPSQGPCLPSTSAQALESSQKGTTVQCSSSNSNNKSLQAALSVQASTSTNMGYRRHSNRVIIPAPLSPPTTRLSRSKESETHTTALGRRRLGQVRRRVAKRR